MSQARRHVWEGLSTRLEGEHVVLEPLAAQHEEALFEVSREPEVWRWLPLAGMPNRADFRGWWEQAMANAAHRREVPFATVERATGLAVGSARYMTLRPEHRGLEIGWVWLAPSMWRTGANAEAMFLMLQHAFERMGCLRVEFKTNAANARSRTALAALPAKLEGVFRRHMVLPGGALRDSAFYSIIDDEWPAVKGNLLARIAKHQAGRDRN